MKPLSLQSTQSIQYTCVSNEFLDNYMPKASGEFVKIYLYVLRYFSGNFSSIDCKATDNCTYQVPSNDCFCVSYLADKFNMTENDVLRSLKYWEKEGLLHLSYDGETDSAEALSGIVLNFEALTKSSLSIETANNPIKKQAAESTKRQEPVITKPTYTKAQIKQFAMDEELSQLFYITEKYLGKTLTSSETNSILFFYEELKMSSDLIEYLLEYCITKGHRSFRYIEKVAIDWVNNGIVTPKDAAKYTSLQSNDAFAVLKAFGITGRNIAPVEQSYINKWHDTYNFNSDIIIEACNRTMNAIHKPSFEYADTILSQWKDKGIIKLTDVDDLDKEHKQSKSSSQGNLASSSATTTKKRQSNNRFNNFSQRDYDYDELEKNMISKKLV